MFKIFIFKSNHKLAPVKTQQFYGFNFWCICCQSKFGFMVKGKNESQQSYGDKKQQTILNMIKTLNFMFLFEC